jgi:hypothetical protein
VRKEWKESEEMKDNKRRQLARGEAKKANNKNKTSRTHLNILRIANSLIRLNTQTLSERNELINTRDISCGTTERKTRQAYLVFSGLEEFDSKWNELGRGRI